MKRTRLPIGIPSARAAVAPTALAGVGTNQGGAARSDHEPPPHPGELSGGDCATSWRTTNALIASFLLLLLGATAAQAQDGRPPILRNVGFDQRLDQQVPLDLEFKDEAGQTVLLGDYFGAKPAILVLAYYRCPMLCTEVLNGLVRGLMDVPFDIGKEFNVLTVSFDPRETPELAAAKKKTYVGRYGRPGAEEGWHFLTGEQEAIRRLTEAVGFRYRYDAKNDQFAHASGIMVLTPQGKIARYLFDINFRPRDLRLGLVEASANRIGSPVDQALLFCFHYDPEEGKYGPAIMNFVRLGGVLTVLGIGTLVGFLLWQERRRARALVSASAAKPKTWVEG